MTGIICPEGSPSHAALMGEWVSVLMFSPLRAMAFTFLTLWDCWGETLDLNTFHVDFLKYIEHLGIFIKYVCLWLCCLESP